MKTRYPFACVQRRREHPDDLLAWAADLLAHPERHGVDERTRGMVADLLRQLAVAG